MVVLALHGIVYPQVAVVLLADNLATELTGCLLCVYISEIVPLVTEFGSSTCTIDVCHIQQSIELRRWHERHVVEDEQVLIVCMLVAC